MTTYAFDGKNFASDSQCTHKKLNSGQTRSKLTEIQYQDITMFIGIVGETNVEPIIRHHISNLCAEHLNFATNNFYVTLTSILKTHSLLEQSDLIVFAPFSNCVYEFYQTNGTYGYHKWETPIAFGSGAVSAMGVLALGLTADYAVAAACKTDIFSNSPIYYIKEDSDPVIDRLDIDDIIMPERWSEMHSDFFDDFKV